MKKILFLFVALFGIVSLSNAQDDYTMFRTMYLTPDYENMEELGKAMADYTEKYGNDGPNRMGVWVVYTGPNTGDWFLTMGPSTFTGMDDIEYSDEQRDHWIFKVLPNVEELSNGEFWRKDDDASYEKEDSFTGKEVLSFFGLKDFEEYRFKEMLKQIKKGYVEKEYDNYYSVYYSQFQGCDKRDVVIVGFFDKWAEFDDDRNFKSDFEDVHGEGSWSKFMREYKGCVESNYDEIIMFVPELSGGREE